MQKKVSKKVLSLLLAVLMVACMLPMGGFAAMAQTSWVEFASSDFTKAKFNQSASAVSGVNANIYKATNVPTATSSDKAMSWNVGEWTDSSNSNGVVSSVDSNGVNVRNGFMYISGYQDGVNPLKGLSAFKVDVQFKFVNDFAVSEEDANHIIKISSNPASNLTITGEKAWNNSFFCQDGYGRMHVDSTGSVRTNEDSSTRLDTTVLSKNTEYHYVVSYAKNHINSYVADADGNIVINYGSYRKSLDTSKIYGLYLGAAGGHAFYQNITYNNVKLYKGTTAADEEKSLGDKNKYLLTYFTGNSAENLNYAVSDDGYNWEALNGNDPVWDSSKLDTSNIKSYPDNSGIAASGHVRDPYAFQAEDGSYYILATDLNTNNGTTWGNNSKLMVWHLNDLADVSTTQPWFIDTQTIASSLCGGNVSRAWAPQAIWDKDAGHYMLYWSVGYTQNSNNTKNHTQMYYVYTDDFKSFLSKPQKLTADTFSNIDGDITYDGSLYYLWYKNEDESKIVYATSECAHGPYSQPTSFTDSNYASKFEGPQVYKLYSTGEYILMTDHFSSSMSYFATYKSTNPADFENNNVSGMNLNYLSPRHGSVVNITTEQYNKLIAKYGKVTYDTTNVPTGKDVNDYLVARYFTNSDANNDSTGNGYNLTSNNVEMTTDYFGRIAAHFIGTAKDDLSDPKATKQGDSYKKTNSYARVSTANMLKNLDINSGVTFSWYGYANNVNTGRWMDWSSAEPGTLSWDNVQGKGSQETDAYAYVASNMEYTAANKNGKAGVKSYRGTTYKNGWHLYTFTITKNYMTMCVDGDLLKYEFAKNGESVSKEGAPRYDNTLDSSFFENIQTGGNLLLGISSWAPDDTLNGYISDFRVYNRALSLYDMRESINKLDNRIPSTDANNSTRDYYDPMEDTTVDGVTYNKYDATVTDPRNIQGNVLNVSGGVTAHNKFSGTKTTASKGYTISTWYNPGENVTNGVIFNIGQETSSGATRKYFYLLENGDLHYCRDAQNAGDNYIDATNVFGTDGLQTNKWSHIVIQVEPSGGWDYVYIYVNGNLTKKISYYTEANAKTDTAYSIHNYLASEDWSVLYGKDGTGYWSNATDGYIDDFTIRNGVYSAKSVYKIDKESIADKLLSVGIKDYQDSMAKLKDADYVYLGMGDAYLAYDRIHRYIDACKYGNHEPNDEEIQQLYDELEAKITYMESHQYKKPTSTVQGYEQSGKNKVDEKYTHNMLTKPDQLYSVVEQDGATNKDGFNTRISTSNFVWLYTGIDGDTPTAPYSVGYYRNTTQSRMAAAFYIANSVPMAFGGASLGSDDNYWHVYKNGYDNAGASNNVNWYYENYQEKFKMDSKYDENNLADANKNQKWYNGSGYARFTGNNSTFTVSSAGDTVHTNSDGTYTSYIYSFTPTYKATYYWSVIGSGYNTDRSKFEKGNGTVQVINYRPVYDALMTVKNKTDADGNNYLANITAYSPDSVKALLSAFDSVTGIDYSLSSTEFATAKAQEIKTKVDTLEDSNLTKNVIKQADYSDVRTVAEENQKEVDRLNGNILDEQGNIVGKYTTSSWNAYKNATNAVTKHYASLNPLGENKNYATSQEQVDQLKNNITAAKSTLVEAADYDSYVGTTVPANQDTKSTKNYNNDDQIYTYDSWINFSDAYNTANAWNTKSAAYKADTEKYLVNYQKYGENNINAGPYIAFDKNGKIVTDDSQSPYYYEYIGSFYENDGDANPSQFETGDYVKINGAYIKLNGHRYYATTVTTTNSPRQSDIITASNDLTDKSNALVSNKVDKKDAYTTFDNAYDTVSSFDKVKYIDPDAVQKIYNDEQNKVYKTLTSADGSLEKYNAATGRNFPEGTKIYNTTLGKTDTNTTNLLTSSNVINNAEKEKYVKKFKASFSVESQTGDTTTVLTQPTVSSAYYGEEFNFGSPEITADQYIKWTVTTFNYGDDNFNQGALGSTKVNVDKAFKRYADSNIRVTAIVMNKTDSDTAMSNTVKVYNAYGKLTNIVYTNADVSALDLTKSSLAIDANNTLTPDEIPFYTFKNWSLNKVSDNEYKIRPIYTVSDICTITAQNGTVTGAGNGSGNTMVIRANALVTVSVDKTALDGDFVAWAVNSNGKYYVASYDPTYAYYTVASETFVPIVSNTDGSGHVTYSFNGSDTALSASDFMLDTDFNYTAAGLTADGYLNAKLAQKAPFVQIIKQVRTEDNKARIYVRSTNGAKGTYGVLMNKTAKVDAKDMVTSNTSLKYGGITNVMDNGQFYVTVNSQSDMSIRVIASYDFSYTDKTVGTSTISVIDYSTSADFDAVNA